MIFDEWWEKCAKDNGALEYRVRQTWNAAIDAAAEALARREEEAASPHTMVPEILALKV